MINTQDRFIPLDSLLSGVDAEISASEAHGVIVGAISNHMKTGESPNILALMHLEAEEGKTQTDQVKEVLFEIYRETGDALLENHSEFGLLLPDDESPLIQRVEGLSDWCRGYLLGLLYNNQFSIDQLPENGAEITRDIMQISEASSGHDEQKEEDWALAELEEYVKVGVQLIFEGIYSERAQQAPNSIQ